MVLIRQPSPFNFFRKLPVIVVSAKSLTFNKVELLRLGADDYLTKPFDLDELLARIERNLLRSQKDTPNLCLTFGELSINTSSKIVTVADEIIVLTAKEYQLVELLAKYPDKVFSKQNLYESIWQEPFARDNDVINTHTGTSENFLIFLINSSPLIKGSIKSKIIKSGDNSFIRSIAFAPVSVKKT